MFMSSIFEAVDSMKVIYSKFNSNPEETKAIFSALMDSFISDEVLTKEYHGLNS
jgi:hypothetical protein